MSVTRMFAALGRFAYRRRWWVIAGWVVLAASGVLAGGQTLDRLTTVDSLSPSAESSARTLGSSSLLPTGRSCSP